MVYSDYTKRRILSYDSAGQSVGGIMKELLKEGIRASKAGIWKFLKKYKETGCIQRKQGSGRCTKMSEQVKKMVDDELEKDDERTGIEISKTLNENGHDLSVSTVLRCRKKLGWTCRGSAYCQLIREGNKVKRLEWAKQHLGDEFKDVIFTDERSVQLEAHRRCVCRRIGHPPRPKPRYLHIINAHTHPNLHTASSVFFVFIM